MRYVVLGASAAGMNGAKTLRQLDPTAEIVLVSKDEKVYSRCILHHYMEGIRTIEQLNFTEADFFETYRIEWKKGVSVTEVNTGEKCILLDNKERVPFDKLLIATGASTRIPPIEGISGAKGVVGFRNLEDIEQIMEQVKKAKHVVVLGGGLVGIDAVSGLLHLHDDITLVESKSHMLPIQLDETAARCYQEEFRKKGVKQIYNASVTNVIVDEQNQIQKLSLAGGETLDCDFLIIATSVMSNIGFLQDSEIVCTRFGLVIDEQGRTSHKDVFGAGDVTGQSPIWPVAVKESIIAAHNMVGKQKKMDDFFSSKCTMNFLGIPTLSLGLTQPQEEGYQIEIEQRDGIYKKIVHKDGKIHGAILQGDLSYSGILTQLIKEQIDISKVEKPIFKIDYSDFFKMDQSYLYSY